MGPGLEPERDEQVRPHAARHWERFLPDRLEAIPASERPAFFTGLGKQAAAQIEELQTRLAGPDPVQGYLDKVGPLNAARTQAEEIVLRELILPAPQDDLEEDDSPEALRSPETSSAPAPTTRRGTSGGGEDRRSVQDLQRHVAAGSRSRRPDQGSGR